MLDSASIKDIKRLLELFPISNLRETWPQIKGVKDELCLSIAETKDLQKITEFVNDNLSCCKQHVYIFNRPENYKFPESIPEGPRILEYENVVALYMVQCTYNIFLRKPLEEASLDFLWPVKMELSEKHVTLRLVVLERSVAPYFDRPCYVADRSVDEKLIVAAVETGQLVRTDIHKGIKSLWEDGFMDSPRAKYKKTRSMASEAMDEEMGIRQYNTELYEALIESPLLQTLFVVPKENPSSVAAFSVEPSTGYLAFTSYSEKRGHTDDLINEILRRNH